MVMHRTAVAFFLSIAALAPVSPCSADDLGRLFTTPEQRARLDAARRGEPAPERRDVAGTAVGHAPQLKLNGTLLSSTGRRQVWVNGTAAHGRPETGVRLLGSDRVQFELPGRDVRRVLRPGQVLDVSSGRVSESYLADAPPAPPAED